MIDAGQASAAALRAVRGLRGPGHASATAAAATGNIEAAFFVERLDRPELSYYLAPWRDARGIVLVVQIDAASGAMNSLAVLPTPMADLVMPVEQARALVATKRNQIAGDPRLVWQPSRESTSPLQPLYRVPIGDDEAYVTMNGAIHDQLTPLGRGG